MICILEERHRVCSVVEVEEQVSCIVVTLGIEL